MTYNTDERLKNFLDANQLGRERLCVAVLGTDRRFSNIRPQHPRGGPDQGKDIIATFEGSKAAVCGIGFLNQANDSAPQKTKIKKKFREDLDKAVNLKPKPLIFVFFTNISLTISDRTKLADEAVKRGMSFCDIFDRERMRIALDSPDGFAARFQYLGIPLSEAEQSTFFAKWGSDIQNIIQDSFSDVKKALNHIIFMNESTRVLHAIYVIFDLDRTYTSEELGHMRAFTVLHLKEPKQNIFGILFGSFDRPGRASSKKDEDTSRMHPGISSGVGDVMCEMRVGEDDIDQNADDETKLKYEEVGRGSSIGASEVNRIVISYQHDGFLFRFKQRVRLKDLDECIFMPITNKSFSEKITRISVIANGYKLYEAESVGFSIDPGAQELEYSVKFSEEELRDPWVKIWPKNLGSAHWLRFQDEVPLRLYDPKFITNTLDPK